VIDNEVSNIIAKIQVNATPQSYILWTNPTDLEVKITNRVIDTVSLYLGTSTNYTTDLGNLDWSLRLTINEWTNYNEAPDYAINMNQAIPDEGIQNLLDEREKAVGKLKKIRSKLSRVDTNETEANAER
tara:strand:+ start:7524 stop:7910 length:387 start_codon:yes stop_codon:yes gene_type:complete